MKAAKGVDFVLNALATAWDLPVMEACLEAGRHYLAMGAGGRRDITGAADLDDQLALDDDFDTGEPLRRFRYQTTSHDESWERWGVQGAAFQTGASAACAVTQLARGEKTADSIHHSHNDRQRTPYSVVKILLTHKIRLHILPPRKRKVYQEITNYCPESVIRLQ